NNSYDDTKNIKDQLYTIQTNLIDSYGLEAEGLDLVNGKYQEQVDILNNLSKQKAKDYLAEEKASFENAKDALNKERTYKLGKLYQGDNKGLINYLKEYDSSFLKLKQVDYGTINQEIKIVANVDDADRELHRLYNDIEQYGKDTGEDVNSVLITISEQLNKTWTDELKTHKDNYDTYVEAEIIYHDTLGQLYLQSKQVVNDYNKALASGESIEEAKNNLDELKNKVAQNTKEVEGSQKVFDDIFSKITTGVQNVNSKINDKSGIQSLFTEAQNKAIDEYQKSISSIGKALSDLNKLSPTEIIDLMQEFPDLAKYGYTGSEGIDALKLALEKVGTQLYNNLDPSIENVELFKQMYKEAMDASNSVFTLAESLSAMSSSGKQVENLTSEFEELGYISTDTLNSLIDKYPQLEQAVADYVSGKITEKELIAEMSKVYQTDYENYREFVIKKKELDEGFYKDAVANLPFWIKDLADSYDIDFGNFKNLQESKLKVAEEYQNKLNEIQELDRRYKVKTLFDPLGIKKDAIGWLYDDAKSKLEKEAEDYKKILDGIDLSLNTTLDIDGYKPSGLPKDKKDKTDPIKEAFDKKKAEIDHLLAMDKITQQDYLNRLEKLNNEYFGKNKAKYLDQYRKYVEEVYKGRKKIDEDAIKNAFNLGTTDSKGNKILGKNDLDYKLAMEEITQEEYLKGLEKINKATFGKHKDKYLEDYRKNEIEIDKGRKAIDKKIAEELVKSKFSDVDHDYAMGRIKTEKEYQTARWELAKEYYKNNKDYLNEWKKAQEEWHKWNIEQTEKELKETEKKRLNTIDKIISKYGELRDAINKTAEYQSGDEQVSTYLEGIKSANKEIKYIENEIKKLNKKKITSLFTQDDYDSQLKTLQSALS
ncbi:MAG: hypothetical protein GX232_03315, partial [Acholeplasmataceae bacterium]|nr:hypothetical protein [Acholeplasmataceae bacterium]